MQRSRNSRPLRRPAVHLSSRLCSTAAVALLSLAPASSPAQVPGNVLLLDGAGDYACTGLTLGPIGGLTVEAWVHATASSGVVLSNTLSGVSFESIELQPDQFILNGSNSSSTRRRVSFGNPLDGWHHIAGVWDGSMVYGYLDGVLVDSTQASSPPWSTSEPFSIGARNSVVTPPVGAELNGGIDELRVWSTARSQEQILSTMSLSLGPEYYASADSGLYSYWDWDSHIQGSCHDASGMNGVENRTAIATGGDADVVSGSLVSSGAVSVPLRVVSVKELAVYPNPFRSTVRIEFAGARGGRPGAIDVFSVTGRHVTTLPETDGFTWSWDGRDSAGRPVAPGVYMLRLQGGGAASTNRLVRVR